MEWHKHISSDPNVLGGKPVIAGTRLSVEHVLGLLESGWTEDEILESYPHITQQDVRACLAYARAAVEDTSVHSPPLSPSP